MLQLLADRFVCDRGRWFDLATARPVTIRVTRIGGASGRRHQLEWSDHCAALSRLRHPLLNPLVDYGLVAAHATFEAYAIMPPLRAGGAAASQAATHAVRFLRAHAIPLSRDSADVIVRPLQPGGRCRRPVGVVLQHRRVLDVLADVLDSGGTGPLTIVVSGPPRSGISTVRQTFARVARLAGYLPIGSEAAHRWPQLREMTAGRHVCFMSDGGAVSRAGAEAAWLARLGIESTRRHLHVTFLRRADATPGALRLDPLGVAAMTSMVYVDPDFGPSPSELFTAARAADGWPGQFLAALRAEPFDGVRCPSASTVHETTAPYTVTTPAAPTSPRTRPRRMESALWRAEARAAALARAGRHGAAIRLLERAIRLLSARQQRDAAGLCALRLVWIARSRGDSAAALAHVERARSLAVDPWIQTAASAATGILWTDDGRYAEAEAALRATMAAATALKRVDLFYRGALGLSRALLWQGRTGDALTALEDVRGADLPDVVCEGLALAARIHAMAQDVAAALGAASQALDRALRSQDARLEASAHRAMALALTLAGDSAGAGRHVTSGLRAAAVAHLPLTALRLRAVLLQALCLQRTDAEATRRMREGLQRAAHARRLPHVVRVQIEAACSDRCTVQSSVLTRRSGCHCDAADVVAELVEAAQRAPDDRASLTRVMDVLCDRLQASSVLLVAGTDAARVMAASGRPWREQPSSARRAFETGLGVRVDRAIQPPEAAEPVRYAGETIAALACRWPAGGSVEPARIEQYLGAAALALSTPVQALLDVRDPPSPTAAWGDLIGESPAAAALRDAVLRAAKAPFSVLIEGESGSGKELVARAIHRLGSRRDRRFCAINCAAITDDLVEAELFGHARGAFTGAATERPGLFEEADGGSLFLDEIGELSARAQAKLLRVLQDGEVRRVGENFARRVDVRLVAATNRSLEQEVAAGRFRADLRFRLDVIRICVPALRDRVADIPALAAHFWHDASTRVGSRATLGPETLAALSRYDWPGNVRELQNAIAWIAVHAPKRGRVGTAMLPSRLAASAPLSSGSFEAAREEFERRFVKAALAQTGGHRGRTADVLGVSRQGLAKMLRRLGIE